MTTRLITAITFLLCFGLLSSCKKKEDLPSGTFVLESVVVGGKTLALQGLNTDVPRDTAFALHFSAAPDTASIRNGVRIRSTAGVIAHTRISYSNGFRTLWLKPENPLEVYTEYTLEVAGTITGSAGETFSGATVHFRTLNGSLTLTRITVNGQELRPPAVLRNIDPGSLTIEAQFSSAIDTTGYTSYFYLSQGARYTCSLNADHTLVTLRSTSPLKDITKYFFNIGSGLKGVTGYIFPGFAGNFYTALDSTLKFPLISDDELLTLVQRRTFAYFWDFGHPACGMARERNTSGDIVTTGGSGFGVMALVVGMERGFVTRDEGLGRLSKILGFLETCDRYHGAWPHWLNGQTGKVVPFTTQDDGADLVETSYMVQGLLTMRQYLNGSVPAEQALKERITALVNAVDYTWFTRGENVLYWHWSPDYGWAMNMPIRGYNETLITYIVAACSPTHPIAPAVYHQGYARNGAIRNGNSYYGYVLPLGEAYGGPLFFTHYSFLGLDPRNLSDAYANYWQQNVNQSLINRQYCITNPKKFLGYSTDCWGLTACDNPWGYNAHSPTNDLGVIAPTAALSAFPYTPAESMRALHHYYYILGNRMFGPYGFYDAFDETEGWWASSTLAIDQGPIVCMIENYRSGLLWDLFMSCPEVPAGLDALGFSH
ncbi:MAG TPA: glucoamylase family protein [Bacteroidales bacterium]|nr:glucoamylase family protein [Bacteroidales bacterium]